MLKKYFDAWADVTVWADNPKEDKYLKIKSPADWRDFLFS